MSNEEALRIIRAYRELIHHAQPNNPHIEAFEVLKCNL